MLLSKLIYAPAILLVISSNIAFASVFCTGSKIIQNQESPCVSLKFPDDTAGSSKFSCNEYKITIDFNFHSDPSTLSLSIVGPRGEVASTSDKSELKLLGSDGSGALIRCEIE